MPGYQPEGDRGYQNAQRAQGGDRRAAAHPQYGSFYRTDRPRYNRLAPLPAAQIIRQIARHGVAAAGTLCHRLKTDGLQVARYFVVEPARGTWLLVQDLVHYHRT